MSRFFQAFCSKPQGRAGGAPLKEEDLYHWGLAGQCGRRGRPEGGVACLRA